MVYKIFHSFHHSKFHLNELRHQTPLAAKYTPRNSRMTWAKRNPVVKLKDSNKMYLWTEATKSQVLMDIELIISENYNLNLELQSQDYPVSPKSEPDTIFLLSLRMKQN